jgi:predicted GIY-YIG superfamily endonuclease
MLGRVHRLVYYETFKYVNSAIARDTSIKEWLRRNKIALIEAGNRTWEALSASQLDGKQILALLRITNCWGSTKS